MQTIIAVFSNAKPGREAEFNEWYTHIHIRDVMRLPGSVAVQRFVLGERQPGDSANHSYLALYEIDDREACTRGHLDNVFTPRMLISDAFRFDDLQEGYMDPVTGTQAGPFSEETEGGVITARFNPRDGRTPEEVEAWFRGAEFERLGRLPGTSGAQLFRHSAEQMLPLPVPYMFLAILRVVDVEQAIEAWRHYSRDIARAGGPVDWAGVSVTSYEALFPRLSADKVNNPSPEAAAAEQDARVAMGDRVYNDFPELPNTTNRESP